MPSPRSILALVVAVAQVATSASPLAVSAATLPPAERVREDVAFASLALRTDHRVFHRHAGDSVPRLRTAYDRILQGAPEKPGTEASGESTSPPESASPKDLAQQVGVTSSSAGQKKSRVSWLVWTGSAALVGLFVATVVHDISNEEGDTDEGAELPYFPDPP